MKYLLTILLLLPPAVERWRPLVESLTKDHPLDTCTVLAAIKVETDGHPLNRRPGSKFRGLLQMGPDAAVDAGADYQNLDEPEVAVRAFLRYMDRYLQLPIPTAAAACWKGGPKVCSNFLEADEAVAAYLERFHQAYEVCNER